MTKTKIITIQYLKIFILATILNVSVLTFVFIFPNKTFASPITSSKLVQLANQERKTRGLSELKVDPILQFAAYNKAKDMLNNNYFEHYSPTNKSPWDFIHEAGYNYQKAGENLAMDFATSEGIHNAWMASQTHQDNILKKDYKNIAIATLKGNMNGHKTTVVVQMFGTPMPKNQITPQTLIIRIRNFILGF